jgi:hypothetical protein
MDFAPDALYSMLSGNTKTRMLRKSKSIVLCHLIFLPSILTEGVLLDRVQSLNWCFVSTSFLS